MWFQKIFGFVWTGAINWYLKDFVTVPLICWQSSALIYLQQKEICYLHSRNLLEITATYISHEVHIKTSVVLTLRVRLIGKSGFRFWIFDLDFDFMGFFFSGLLARDARVGQSPILIEYGQPTVWSTPFRLVARDWPSVRTYASTDCTGRVGETIKGKGGVSQACLGKSIILAIHNMVNWLLSKQDSHWPVSHCHIEGSCVNSSRWRDLFGSCPLTSCFTRSRSMFNLILSS